MSLYINQWTLHLNPEGCSQEFLVVAVEMNDLEENAVGILSVPSRYAGGFLWGCIKAQISIVNIIEFDNIL